MEKLNINIEQNRSLTPIRDSHEIEPIGYEVGLTETTLSIEGLPLFDGDFTTRKLIITCTEEHLRQLANFLAPFQGKKPIKYQKVIWCKKEKNVRKPKRTRK
jgi:hypothetical protein